jgi:hypothetical protein
MRLAKPMVVTVPVHLLLTLTIVDGSSPSCLMPCTGIRCPTKQGNTPVPLNSTIAMDSPSPPPMAGGHSSPTWELVQVTNLGYEHKFPVDTKQDQRDASRVGKPTRVPWLHLKCLYPELRWNLQTIEEKYHNKVLCAPEALLSWGEEIGPLDYYLFLPTTSTNAQKCRNKTRLLTELLPTNDNISTPGENPSLCDCLSPRPVVNSTN